MKRVILSAYIIVSATAAIYAQDGKPTPVPTPMSPTSPAPGTEVMATKVQNIEFVQFKEIAYEFGNIKAGIPASHTFEYKNVGNKDITIDNVNASCGCTTPNWKGGVYKPGETGQVTATYNAASVGGFNKSVTVSTSEGAIVLTISGNVMDAGAYDEWKAKKDADDALKAQEDAAKSKSKSGKTKANSKTSTAPKTTKSSTKGS